MIAPGPIVRGKLRRGDTVRLVTPARSRKPGHDRDGLTEKRFAAQGEEQA